MNYNKKIKKPSKYSKLLLNCKMRQINMYKNNKFMRISNKNKRKKFKGQNNYQNKIQIKSMNRKIQLNNQLNKLIIYQNNNFSRKNN